ncbi:MAG: response regulator [Verrucomicrobia bacterium]|nr:response regulator [Verrucomicrobiota bacterium]
MSHCVPPETALESKVASELNNLLQIISGTSALIENVWDGAKGSEKYFEMLRTSIERAEQVTAQLVARAGGTAGKVHLHLDFNAPSNVVTLPPAEPRKRSILITDDEPMALALLGNLLGDAGYEVSTAQSGFECLDRFRRAPHLFDLVLLDLAMPCMNGEETFMRLRQIFPATEVVLMAGFVEAAQLARMMNNGLAGFLAKPFTSGDAIALADSVIERARQRRTGTM